MHLELRFKDMGKLFGIVLRDNHTKYANVKGVVLSQSLECGTCICNVEISSISNLNHMALNIFTTKH